MYFAFKAAVQDQTFNHFFQRMRILARNLDQDLRDLAQRCQTLRKQRYNFRQGLAGNEMAAQRRAIKKHILTMFCS